VPYFSIVVPMYNRGRLIGRAMASCLGQTFGDFEVVVVDDGSTDDSVAVVQRCPDPRIRLLQSPRNCGVCPARNRGVAAATGEWIVFLDSDDELAPDGLEIMRRRASAVSEDIGRMAFMYRLDDGSLSPQPALVEAVWDYPAYLRWLDSLGCRSDFSNCIRRRTFDLVKLPEDRAYERIYHLEFARHFKSQTFPDIVAWAHADADNRTVDMSLNRLLSTAGDEARSANRVLAGHGAGMAEHCPATFRRILRSAAIRHFLAGNRLQGWKHAFGLLRRQPFWLGGWALLPLAVLDSRTLGRLLLWNTRRRFRGTA
jgi:glycosyltransferase involved in cell wall biosynthesis